MSLLKNEASITRFIIHSSIDTDIKNNFSEVNYIEYKTNR